MSRVLSLLNRVWASGGVKTDPDTDVSAGADLVTVSSGHIDSQGPFSSHMNWEQNRIGALMNLVEQAGILEWSTLTTYELGALCKIDKSIYQSLSAANLNNPPASSPTKWKLTPLGELPVDYVKVVDTITSLRALEGLTGNQGILLIQSGYAGDFWVDGSDAATADDGFDVFVTTDGKRVKRLYPEKPITITGDTTLTIAHHRRVLRVTAAAEITLPDDLPTGFQCQIKRATASEVTFASADTVEAEGGSNAIAEQFGWVGVYRDASGLWSLVGYIDLISV